MADMIYKLTTHEEWEAAKREGIFHGSSLDRSDGFIHFSTAEQTHGTAQKYFHGQEGLLMLAVNPALLGDALKWEPSRNGELFPHLYAPLTLDAVVKQTPISLRESGEPIIALLENNAAV